MNKLKLITEEISKVVMGKEEVIRLLVISITAGGHILLEDIPGVGKTTLALALSKTLGLKYNRVQFTPDVMPADIIGFNMYNQKSHSFDYMEGAAVCNLFLADEINRTSSKTQSALLELMEEGKYTVEGVTRELPKPFVTIATQNPFGSAGTQRLPQSQIERFMVRMSIGYPDADAEVEILKGAKSDKLSVLNNIMTSSELLDYQKTAEDCFVKDNIYKYIVDIVNATRNNSYINIGISPRGSIAILKMAKANAVFNDRDYVVQEDIIDIIAETAAHRIELSPEGRAKGLREKQVIMNIVKDIKIKG
ncbi:MAG: MoxR family ATPase [Clostridia bacterium]|nr:MoxR family ATPase [Clostridia bacterium]